MLPALPGQMHLDLHAMIYIQKTDLTLSAEHFINKVCYTIHSKTWSGQRS